MSGWSAVTAKEAEPGTWVIADSECNETGEGKGLESLKDAFDDSKIQFACIRVVGVDERESVVSRRPKLVRINWVGGKVKAHMKFAALQGKAKVAETWQGTAAEIALEDKDDLTMNEVGVTLLKCGGAHKPTKYDFGDCEIPLTEVKNSA